MKTRLVVTFPSDPSGYHGRQCPVTECRRYFKVTVGTGVPDATECICAYCGHSDSVDNFVTDEQFNYAMQVATDIAAREIFDAIRPAFEFGSPNDTLFARMKYIPPEILPYVERELETALVCDGCGLRYAVYGLFAFCPDCGKHNSLQIFERNLSLAQRIMDCAPHDDVELSYAMVTSALQQSVAAFDGYGRELCRVALPNLKGVTFQNLLTARNLLQEACDFDMAAGVDDWAFLCRTFQKRHLVVHRMGVVDGKYLAETNDTSAELGRRISLTSTEVRETIVALKQLSRFIADKLPRQS